MEKNFDKWNETKKKIHGSTFSDFVHEREVWWCSLGTNIGFEQDGKNENFERPVLVLKKFNKEIILVIPLSTKIKNLPYHFPHLHNNEEYSALLSQVRVVSTKRLLRRIYKMDSNLFAAIKQTTRDVL